MNFSTAQSDALINFTNHKAEKFVATNVSKDDVTIFVVKKMDNYPFIIIASYDQNLFFKALLNSYINHLKTYLLALLILFTIFLSHRFVVFSD